MWFVDYRSVPIALARLAKHISLQDDYSRWPTNFSLQHRHTSHTSWPVSIKDRSPHLVIIIIIIQHHHLPPTPPTPVIDTICAHPRSTAPMSSSTAPVQPAAGRPICVCSLRSLLHCGQFSLSVWHLLFSVLDNQPSPFSHSPSGKCKCTVLLLTIYWQSRHSEVVGSSHRRRHGREYCRQDRGVWGCKCDRITHTHTLGTLRPEASWLKQIEVLNCHLLSLLLIVIVIALFASLSRHFAHYHYLCVR